MTGVLRRRLGDPRLEPFVDDVLSEALIRVYRHYRQYGAPRPPYSLWRRTDSVVCTVWTETHLAHEREGFEVTCNDSPSTARETSRGFFYRASTLRQ